MQDNESPTRENCDLEDPEEMFLWMFVALPGLKGAPMLLPTEYYRGVSKRLHELGARLVEEPTLKYQPPRSGDPHWITGMGQWVTLDTPDPVELTMRTVVQSLSQADRAAFEAELIRQATEGE
ncbi:phage gene 29 protein family protein [Rhodococcus sp. AQ5-07]|uniref:phage gene 29 protein family protein n=1 Tax=Rhodococcus sp. AQ5-07 TaxID=2054902 RepID=UPI000DC00091|nr:DUF2744 domain-containing protein [Rhodococcus sp. AQ5-07]RAL31144.1 hypothetical protein CVN56_29690 [Rhodococcus sp. AQ5-07]